MNKPIRFKQLTALVGLGKSAIYDRLDPDSPRHDPTFPKPFKLGESGRAIAFDWEEIQRWLDAQKQQRVAA